MLQVDYIFAPVAVMARYVAHGDVEALTDTSLQCTSGGLSAMSRKDNSFAAYWNEGVRKIVASGAYRTLCEDAATRHGKQYLTSLFRMKLNPSGMPRNL